MKIIQTILTAEIAEDAEAHPFLFFSAASAPSALKMDLLFSVIGSPEPNGCQQAETRAVAYNLTRGGRGPLLGAFYSAFRTVS